MNIDVHSSKSINDGIRDGVSVEGTLVAPFKRSKLKSLIRSSTKIDQKRFINTLNYYHFMNSQVFAIMTYPLTHEEFLFRVDPSPCLGNHVTFSLPQEARVSFDAYEMKSIMIDNGDSIIVMDVKSLQVSSHSITVELKSFGTIFHARQAKRHKCVMVEAYIQLSNVKLEGFLKEFNHTGLCIKLNEDFQDIVGLLKPRQIVTIDLSKNGQKILSGTARLIRTEYNTNTIVLNPMNIPLKRYQERRYRNQRLNPIPSPSVVFEHPFISKGVQYDVVDLNTSGFSIEEKTDRVLFIPGMIFRDMEIVFSGEFSLRCSAQVIYSKKQLRGITKFGFLITDIDPATYTRLFNLLTRTDDPHSLASAKVSIDSLWDFFFRSGFIYPEKYQCISQYKENFKAIYEHLYHNCPEIFSSLTYQMNEQIYGHVSIIKAYPSTWMVQHLAALPMGTKRTGLFVLNQILNYLDGFHRMPSIGMKYLVFNYRPNNKFPNYFFGGVCRNLNAPHMCSIDQFAYLIYSLPETTNSLPVGWEVSLCEREDFIALNEAYRKHSQGLMIEAFGLGSDDKTLWDTYEKLGLKRSCKAYVLTRDGDRTAFFIVDQSNRALNLSDLLNSIKIIIPYPDPRALPWKILQGAISILGRGYNMPDVVLQVFPSSYLDAVDVHYPKSYCMWIAKTQYFDPHFDAIKRMTRFKYIKFIKSIIEERLGLHK